MQTNKQKPDQDATIRKVKEAKDNAAKLMRESGHDIGDIVKVRIDPNLPFMGYTMPLEDGTFRIVVAGNAVDSGMLEGLLVHEMSHVYRMKSHHPSHDASIIEGVINNFGKDVVKYEYQEKIMHDILNDVQDLYADDVSFKVIRQGRVFPVQELTRFLQSWVKEEPEGPSDDAKRDRWVNAGILVHNARAIAQMERHKVPDIEGRAERASHEFLSKVPGSMAREFGYFRDLLANMDEALTEDGYRKLLNEYVGRFLSIAGENYPG